MAKTRNEEIRRRAIAGERMTRLALEYGLSKQRVWQIVHLEQNRAHAAANEAYRRGQIDKPRRCEGCQRRTKRLEKHHADYSRPLEVRWLCNHCHPRANRADHGTRYKRWVEGSNV